jgi:hypothetical protein
MSQIDVTELLTDPDFVDKVQLISRTTEINTKGENILSESCSQTVGCVQPISGKTLLRLPENFRVDNMMSFWIKGSIIAVRPGKYSSVIVFRGRRFNVQHVFDWTQAGAGWCEGACIAEVPAA